MSRFVARFDAVPVPLSALEPILDAAPPEATCERGATRLGRGADHAGRATRTQQPGSSTKAAQAAFGVLDRTRSSGGCDGQLDLLLLVAGDRLHDERNSGRRAAANRSRMRRTSRRRVGLSGKLSSAICGLELAQRPTSRLRNDARRARGSHRYVSGLTERFPGTRRPLLGSVTRTCAPVSGCYTASRSLPRQDLRLAVAQYNRAAALGAAHDADLGRARALVGLGESQRAVGIVAPLVASSPRPGGALEVLLTADEGARDFAGAETVARRLAQTGPTTYPICCRVLPSAGVRCAGLAGRSVAAAIHGRRNLDPTASRPRASGRGRRFRPGPVVHPAVPRRHRSDHSPDLLPVVGVATRRHSGRACRSGPRQLARRVFRRAAGRVDEFLCHPSNHLQGIAELVAQRPITETALSKDDLTDKWQNLLRWAGDLPTARKVDLRPGRPRPATGASCLPSASARSRSSSTTTTKPLPNSDIAARRVRRLRYDDDLAVYQAELNRGAALFAAGRNAEAVALLRPLVQLGTQGYAYQARSTTPTQRTASRPSPTLPPSSSPTTRARPAICTLRSTTTTRP